MTAAPAEPATLAERLSDRVNPIALKELRQAVKSRFVVGLLLTLLGVMVAVLVGHAASLDPARGATSGGGVWLFAWLNVVLLGVAGVGLPLYTCVRLAVERASAAGDLMLMTALRPWQVVRGKLAAGLATGAVIASACVPFLVVSWLLRGIGIVSILLWLLFDAAFVLVGLSLAIMVGASRFGPVGKVLLAAFAVTGMPILFAVLTFGCLGACGGWFFSAPLFFALMTAVPLAVATQHIGPPPQIRRGDLRYAKHARRMHQTRSPRT